MYQNEPMSGLMSRRVVASSGESTQEIEEQQVHTVAIVGLGPKGFYCLERLLAEFNARPLNTPLRIHVFNRSPHFGASPIYDPDQPEYIKANINAAVIDLWDAPDPPIVGERGANFVNWYHETVQPPQPLTGEEYLSRSVIGRYLMEGFRHLLKQVPLNVTVFCHVAEVVDIRPQQQGYELEFVAQKGYRETIKVDKILLATGHSSLTPGYEEKRYHEFTLQHKSATFIPFVYPVVEVMGQVSAGAKVAMKGMGLTFIDAVLELTEGRGGRFERSTDGTLSYIACGKEPRSIFPFCRSGLPMVPKVDRVIDLPPLTFLTENALANLRRQAPGGKLDLERDLWPLVELEMQLCYYRVEMKTDEDRDRLVACGNDAEAVRLVIEDYLLAHPEQARFDCWQVLEPIGDCRFATGEELTDFIGRYMEQEIARAYRGPTQCGIRAAIDIWYEVRKTLGLVLQFGGLTPESHKKLVEYYFPRFKRVSFGPPILNIEKLLALLKAGFLDCSVARSPRLRLDEVNECFELQCDDIPKAVVQVDTLIDARYPDIDISRDVTPLYQNLFQRGTIGLYENKSMLPNQQGYYSGAIDMTEQTQFVVNREGVSNEDIAVIGIPTEGNLVGNFAMLRDSYSGIWAVEVIEQLRCREQSWLTQKMEKVL